MLTYSNCVSYFTMAFLGGRSKSGKGKGRRAKKAASHASMQKKTISFTSADGKKRVFQAHVKRRKHYASPEELAQSMQRKGMHPALIKNAVAKWRASK